MHETVIKRRTRTKNNTSFKQLKNMNGATKLEKKYDITNVLKLRAIKKIDDNEFKQSFE